MHPQIVALIALLALASSARGECPLQSRASIPVNIDAGLPLVSVLIGHQTSTLILDTGAERTVITATGAQRLGLQPHHEYPRTISGLKGAVATGTADVPVSAAGIPLTHFGVQVGSLSLPTLGYATPDGLLGADVLSRFEVELDLPHGFLRLFERVSCDIARPTWTAPYDTVAANRSLHDRLFFPLTLDGRNLSGIFDSGSQRSIIDETAAQKIAGALVTNQPAGTVRGIASETVPAYAHRFGRLSIGAETMLNPSFTVVKLPLNDAKVIVGMDYLRWHDVWLSYGSHQIFIKNSR